MLLQSIEGIVQKLLACHAIGHSARSHGCADAAGRRANESTAHRADAWLDGGAHERTCRHTGRNGRRHAAHGAAQAWACAAEGIARAGGLATLQPLLAFLLHALLVGRIGVKRRPCLR